MAKLIYLNKYGFSFREGRPWNISLSVGGLNLFFLYFTGKYRATYLVIPKFKIGVQFMKDLRRKDSETSSDHSTNDELTRGKTLATNLVLHLNEMGAAGCTIPVEHEGLKYEISVQVKQ